MRTYPSSRSLTPKLRANTRHLWVGDQQEAGSWTPSLYLKLEDDADNTNVYDEVSETNGTLSKNTTAIISSDSGKLGKCFTGLDTDQYADGFDGFTVSGLSKLFIEIWYNWESDTGTDSQCFLSQVSSLWVWAGVWKRRYSGADYICFGFSNSTPSTVGTFAMPGSGLDEWHQACFYFDGSLTTNKVRGWIDGVEATSVDYHDDLSVIPDLSADTFALGCQGSTTSLGAAWPNGIDNVRVFTSSEIPTDPQRLATAVWNGGSGTTAATADEPVSNLRDLCGYGGNCIELTQVSSPGVAAGFGAAGSRTFDGTADYFYKSDGGAAGTTYTPAVFLRCEDNAANTTVTNAGTAGNGALSSGTTAGLHTASGKINGAFTGLSGTQHANNFGAYKYTGGKFFFSVWLKAASAPGASQQIFSQSVLSAFLMARTSGDLWFRPVGTNTASLAFSYDGNWHHVAGCYDKDAGSNNSRIWLDGVEGTPATDTGNVPDRSQLAIGDDGADGYDSWTGGIDLFWFAENFTADPQDLVDATYNSGSGIDDVSIIIGGDSAATDQAALDGDCSIAIAFKAESAANKALLWYGHDYNTGAGAPEDMPIEVLWNSTKKITFAWDDGAGEEDSTTFDYVFTLDKWYLIHLVRDTANKHALLYVNGELQQTADYTADPSVSNNEYFWGVGAAIADGSFAYFFDGSIAAVRVDSDIITADEAALDFRRAMNWSHPTSIHCRALVKDHGGTFQNLSSIYGNNYFANATISDDADQNCVTASVTLKRDIYNYSLSKYHDNKLNRPSEWGAIGPDGITYNTDGHEDLLDINREIKIEWARTPLGSPPLTFAGSPPETDWRMAFHGYIDTIDWAGDDIKLECRDLGSLLLDAYIEATTQFPTNGVDHTLAATIYDGAGETTSQHGILNEAGRLDWFAGTPPVLVEPTASGTNITTWYQDRQPILTTICGLAEQIGWLCRYRWYYTDADFALTLYQPARTKTTADAYLTSNDYLELTQLKIDKSDIRNVVQVVFSSTAPGSNPSTCATYGGWGAASGGQPGQYYVRAIGTEIDAGYSFTRYRRQFCELVEQPNISTYAQAEALALNICRDLMEPTALLGANLFLFPEVECEDMILFGHDDRHTTVDLRLACYSVNHNFDRDRGRTTLTLRGKPSGGSKRHLVKECRTSGALPPIVSTNDILACRSSRHRLAPAQAIIEESDTLRTNGEQLVANSDFNDQTFGTASMPDCWFINTGTFNTSISVETTNTKLGDKSLKLSYNATTPIVYSKMFAVTDDCALQFKYTFKADASGQRIGIRVLQYESLTDSSPDEVVVSNTDATTSWQTIVTNIPVHSGKKLARVKLTAYTLTSGHYILYDTIEARKMYCTAYVTNDAHYHVDKDADPVQLVLDSLPAPPWSEGYNALSSFDIVNYKYVVKRAGIYRISTGTTLNEGEADQTWTARCDVYKDGSLLVSGPETEKTAATETSYIAYTGSQYFDENDEVTAYITYTADYTGTVPYVDADQSFMYIDLIGE